MGFADLSRRLNAAVTEHLADGLATYRRADGETIEGVPYELDLEFATYDDPESGLARLAKTIEIPVEMVPDSGTGDVIVTPSREWAYLKVLADDGDFRRIEVM